MRNGIYYWFICLNLCLIRRTKWELNIYTKKVAIFIQSEEFIKKYIQAIETSQEHKFKPNSNASLFKYVRANATEVSKGTTH